MSLIAEALRKAHLDARQQEAARGGHVPYVAAAIRAVRRPSKAPWIAALVASNLLIALLVLGALRLSGGGGAAAAANPAPPPPAEAAQAPAPERLSAEIPAARTMPTAGSAPAPAVAPPPAMPRVARPGADPAPTPALPPRPEVRGSGGALRAAYGTSLPDGRELELSGIVATPVGKQAMINDRLVREGDRIEGLTVVRIDRRGVELRGEAGLLYLEIP